MVSNLRSEFHRRTGSVLIYIREGIGIQEIAVRIEVETGIHRDTAKGVCILSVERIDRLSIGAQVFGRLKENERIMFSIGEGIERRRPFILHLDGAGTIIR